MSFSIVILSAFFFGTRVDYTRRWDNQAQAVSAVDDMDIFRSNPTNAVGGSFILSPPKDGNVLSALLSLAPSRREEGRERETREPGPAFL